MDDSNFSTPLDKFLALILGITFAACLIELAMHSPTVLGAFSLSVGLVWLRILVLD